MATFAVVDIEKGFENQGRICKCVEEALWELGLRDKLEEVLIKHTPSGSAGRDTRQALQGGGIKEKERILKGA